MSSTELQGSRRSIRTHLIIGLAIVVVLAILSFLGLR